MPLDLARTAPAALASAPSTAAVGGVGQLGGSGAATAAVKPQRALLDLLPDPEPPAIPGSAPVSAAAKTGRNAACPCGSGKKYKRCHLAEDEANPPRIR